jgi:hypothetical protein
LLQGYPRLKIAQGEVGADGEPTTPELAQAWAETDLYLNGSGSGFPGRTDALAFRKATGKPLGVFGVSTDPISGFGPGREPEGGTLNEIRAKAERLPPDHLDDDTRYVIDRAAFFFCRDTISRDYLRSQQLKTPIIEFGPDAQLGMTLRDDATGFAYLERNGLEEGKFICVIPRLRYTPYYRIRNIPRVPDDDVKDAINDRTTEQDHAKLRDMIIRYVRETGNKVLACPEMTYQIELAKEVLVDPLPEEIKPNVVWRDSFWLPDEAASVYSKALAVVSVECHSPLIALHNGTPAFYVRQPTDTCKGRCTATSARATGFLRWTRPAGGWAAAAVTVFQPLSAQQLQQTAGTSLPPEQQRTLADPIWPTLRHYRGQSLERLAMPVGGVGTGCLFLTGNGALRDFEVANRPAKGFTPVVSGGAPFFAIWFDDGRKKGARVLEGPLPVRAYEGSHGSLDPTHNLPRFADAGFYAAWPLGRLELRQPDMPLRVSLKAFSPFIPTDEDASGWPMAVLRYEVTNPTSSPVKASVCGSLPNFVGMNGWETTRDWKGDRQPSGASKNRNREGSPASGLAGLFMDSEGVAADSEAWGSLALSVLQPSGDDADVSLRTNWTNPQVGRRHPRFLGRLQRRR